MMGKNSIEAYLILHVYLKTFKGGGGLVDMLIQILCPTIDKLRHKDYQSNRPSCHLFAF